LNPNGTIKWAHSPSVSSIASSPVLALDGNTVYIVDDSTTLYAYSSSGTFQWSYQLSDTPIGTGNDQSPSIGTDGTIYVGSPDNYLYAINPNGTLKWRFLTGESIDSTPALAADGTIYIGSNGLYALNPNGTQKWKFSNPLFSSASPIIGGDGLIYWRVSFTAYAVNPNGTEKWNLFVWPFSSAALDSTSAIGPDGTLYMPTSAFGSSGQNGLDAYAPSKFIYLPLVLR
ncbi:MAG: WD40-like repeat protein, partial [Anaerolineales bacterium]|nr:WD40-like repeat protein [Anaerolineales bacterium]